MNCCTTKTSIIINILFVYLKLTYTIINRYSLPSTKVLL